MAFENAIITKEDDEKYGLSALYGKYNYGAKLPNLNFTIDRQLDCWLLKIYSFPDPNYDRAILSKSLWILHYNNKNIEIIMDYNFDIDSTISLKKFHRIWKILGLKPSLNSKTKMRNIFHLLQKSLEAYGDYDAWQSDPNYTMELQDLTDRKIKIIKFLEEERMAFENAIITKDDDEKYGLSEIYYKYNPYYETFINELDWTIDRNADCWLMPVYSFPDPDYDHASLAKGIWILYHKGEIIEVTLDYIFDEGKKLHRIWQLLKLTPKTTNTLSKKDIVALLFKILKAYGYAGIWQKENYTMELQDLTDHAAK